MDEVHCHDGFVSCRLLRVDWYTPSLTSKSIRTLLSRMDKWENCLEAEERGRRGGNSQGRHEAFPEAPGPVFFPAAS